MMFSPFGIVAPQGGPVTTYTLDEQRALATKTLRKVRAFLLGAYRFEARYADHPNDRISIESGGVVLTAAQLEVGVRYNVFWDFEGESGSDIAWKFRGDGGLAESVCTMEDSMADDPNIRMPGNLLQMAATTWAQTFYDMIANYEIHGSVVRLEEPRPENEPDQESEEKVKVKEEDEEGPKRDPDQEDEEKEKVEVKEEDEDEDEEDDEEDYQPNYAAMVAAKWNPIFERVKANEYDVECMFVHSTQGCLAPPGTCPFKHTPLRDHAFSDGGYGRGLAMDGYEYGYEYYMGWDSD
ncbi:hypothetical protein MVEN_02360900 [Mycena venus]|uniref:Uncharacterized protein n=1 Tax=Mycena venus TaxID=2733690 RepID=A0A8H6X397_9AGAR|nr:hypothetical protein MVEN_02360900 [Mycena venus]